MAVARWIYLPLSVAVTWVLLLGGVEVAAQPLVTGNLLYYYDFDNFTDTVTDGSGNGFNGRVQDATRSTLDGDTGRTSLVTTGVISNDHVVTKRGGGAIRFTQSTVPLEDGVFLDMDGGKNMAANPGLATHTARTFAAWVNLTDISSDTTIFNGSSLNHANAHFQVQGGGAGKIRFTSRQESSGTNIFDTGPAGHIFVNQPAVDGGAAGTPWPINEWHHIAVSADINANAGAGEMKMYYDGQLIYTAPKIAAATETTFPIWQTHGFNEFYDGLGLGAVYDSSSRRTNGLLDEAYIFTRALSAAEVQTLYNIAPPGVNGDYNGNGVVDAADYVLWRNGGPLQNDATPGVQAGDYDVWKARFGATTGSGAAVGAVPEPASIGLLLVCLGMLAGGRRHR